MGISLLIYNIGLGAYHMGIQFSAPFNPKAQKWVAGRKDWHAQLQRLLNGKPVIWVHCASLGEYEQGKPVIDALEVLYPQKQVLVSFYSPSGYGVVKLREPQRAIIYLPPDSANNAERFLSILKPQLAIFIKYEFWYHYLSQLNQNQVPTLLVSGIFRKGQPFFKPWGGLHRQMLASFEHLFVQDAASEELLKGIGFQNVIVSGDTRFDRVGDILLKPKPFTIVESFVGSAPVFVAGSTWPADDEMLLSILPQLINKGWKVIIAPHDIHAAHIQQLQRSLGDMAITYSAAESSVSQQKDILIIDSVGLLAHIYKYGKLAYIGGGFGKGIHNTLEAAANGLPVIFGPNYDRFKEAQDLVEMGGAWPIKDVTELTALVKFFLENPVALKSSSEVAREYTSTNQGATALVMGYLEGLA